MEMRSGPKVSGRSRRVAADQGWSLRGVPLYNQLYVNNKMLQGLRPERGMMKKVLFAAGKI